MDGVVEGLVSDFVERLHVEETLLISGLEFLPQFFLDLIGRFVMPHLPLSMITVIILNYANLSSPTTIYHFLILTHLLLQY